MPKVPPRPKVPAASHPPAIRLPDYYLGVDPGASGGLAALAGINRPHLAPTKMPDTERDVWDWLHTLRYYQSGHIRREVVAVIEKVGGYVSSEGGAEKKPQPGSAMFKFGMSYGGLRMALVGLGIRFEEVGAGTWQRSLGVTPRLKGEPKSAHKNRLKAKAQQLFPEVKVTLAIADALLIAEFCKRRVEGRL